MTPTWVFFLSQVSTGALKVRWNNAHDGDRITAMAFDLNFRRLITACDTGGMKVVRHPAAELCLTC